MTYKVVWLNWRTKQSEIVACGLPIGEAQAATLAATNALRFSSPSLESCQRKGGYDLLRYGALVYSVQYAQQ